MLRTVIYLRKSSEDETEKQAQSIERQRRDILAFIQKHNEMEGPEMYISYGSKDIIQEDASAKTP